MKFNENDHVKHKVMEWEGVVQGHWNHSYQGKLYAIRWDDPGLDDDFVEEDKLEFIPQECFWCHHGKGYHYDESVTHVMQMPCNATDGEGEDETPCNCYGWCTTKEEADAIAAGQVNQIFIFPNGNVAVTDNNGQQMPHYQGSWINFDYIRKLASIALRDNARVVGRMPNNYLGDMMDTLKKGESKND